MRLTSIYNRNYLKSFIEQKRWIFLSLSLTVFLFFGTAVSAATRLPGFFTDNMVLQRDRPVQIWGWGDPGKKVTVSFGGQEKSAEVDKSGRWLVHLDPMVASGEPRVMTVDDSIKIKNVLVGDVWICSGQSNMEWVVQNTQDAKTEIAKADFLQIRHLKIGHQTNSVPSDNLKANWIACSPKTVSPFTAVGYFFGRRLHTELKVPIGLIGANWGGTRIEPWIPYEGYHLVPELKAITDKIDSANPSTPLGKKAHQQCFSDIRQWLPEAEKAVEQGLSPKPAPQLPSVGISHQDPMQIFHAMVNPLIPYAIRGVIWYQGESNGNEGESYFHKMQALIKGWRKLWKQGEFPFYFVQLTNYGRTSNSPAGGDGWSLLREAQRKTLTVENTGMAVIIDIGAGGDIHPRNKQDVGWRLAQWALAKEYGKDIVPSGPLYKSYQVEGNTIRIEFDHVGKGLMVGKKEGLEPVQKDEQGSLKKFAIAGEDKVWHWADAKIDGNSVIVSSPKVQKPVAVRYAFQMNPVGCNLYNEAGIPASPFRTDNW